jgi:hypothetical protein
MPNTKMVLPNQISKLQTFKFCIIFHFICWKAAILLALYNPLKISQAMNWLLPIE